MKALAGIMTVDLLAGRAISVGSVTVAEVDNPDGYDPGHYLDITYTVVATLVDPDPNVPGDEYLAQWYLLETHLAVVSSVGVFPMAKGGKLGCHSPNRC